MFGALPGAHEHIIWQESLKIQRRSKFTKQLHSHQFSDNQKVELISDSNYQQVKTPPSLPEKFFSFQYNWESSRPLKITYYLSFVSGIVVEILSLFAF